jgi:glyoxylate reductase
MSKPRILLTNPVPPHVRAMLEEACEVVTVPGGGRPSREQLVALLPTVDGIFTSSGTRLDNDLLDACPRLQVISNSSVGYDNVNIPHATKRGVLVCHTPGVLSAAVRDITFALLLNLARHIPANDRHVRTGAWQNAPGHVGIDVQGKTLGIIGLGRIGHLVARTAHAFDLHVIYYDPVRDPEAEASGLAHYRARDDVFREADFLTVHCYLDETTYHHIGRREFRLMKPTAYFINTARGAVVDEAALVEALQRGLIAGAGLDVMEQEPIPADHPLCAMPNVVLLPHIGSGTVETRRAMVELAARNIIAALTGGTPEAMVNPEVLERRRAGVV